MREIVIGSPITGDLSMEGQNDLAPTANVIRICKSVLYETSITIHSPLISLGILLLLILILI